jgi:hypothetical protein
MVGQLNLYSVLEPAPDPLQTSIILLSSLIPRSAVVEDGQGVLDAVIAAF